MAENRVVVVRKAERNDMNKVYELIRVNTQHSDVISFKI